MYIEIEGPEGSFKSTVCGKLSELLKNKEYSTALTRQPGGTRLAEKTRALMLEPPYPINQHTMLHLALASRSDLMEKEVSNLVNKFSYVISDRGNLSTIGLQGYAGGVDINLIEDAISSNPCIVIPDYIFFLKISHETSVRRQQQRGTTDYIEKLGRKFHKQVIEGMTEYSRLNKDGCPLAKKIVTIECELGGRELTSDEIANLIFNEITGLNRD